MTSPIYGLSPVVYSSMTKYLHNVDIRVLPVGLLCHAGADMSRALYLNRDLELPRCARCDKALSETAFGKFCEAFKWLRVSYRTDGLDATFGRVTGILA